MDDSLGLCEPNIVHNVSPSEYPKLFPRATMLSDKSGGSFALREKSGVTENQSLN
jgi:hypothetical protein